MQNSNKKSPKISDFITIRLKYKQINYFLTVFFTDFVAFLDAPDFPL